MIPKEFLINYDELKVGDPLWSAMFGDVTIRGLNHDTDYPILVVSENGEYAEYTRDGFFVHDCDSLPTLFKSCPYKEEERVVGVRDKETERWYDRKLITESRGKFICWNSDTYEEAYAWKFMREITEPNKVVLTKAEIAEKFGLDPNAEIVVE